jgi:hypothetical protein
MEQFNSAVREINGLRTQNHKFSLYLQKKQEKQEAKKSAK